MPAAAPPGAARPLRVFAAEPWYGGSHQRFLDDLARHSRHRFVPVTMAARYWKWRMQGGAVTLAEKLRAEAAAHGRPDVLFASDMVHLPALKALAPDVLAGVPTVLYFHENQLTYPLREGQARDVTYAYINYLSALVADRVVFNSHFHHDAFFEALPDLLRRFPDYTHVGTLPALRAKASVLHLGLDLAGLDAHAPPEPPPPGPPILLWNHRWEYDKDPEAFFRIVNRLDDAGLRFRLILAGQTFAEQPPAFAQGFRRYAERVIHYGFAETFADYARLLHTADLVVSTARHEFFGIAMMEAIYCGCHPLLPDRLTYPELIPASLHRPLLHAPILYDSEDALFEQLRRLLRGEDQPLPREVLRRIAEPLAWPAHAPRYDALFEELAQGASAGAS
ncbi:MAG: DUF3524 domain-containing protein [Rubricoccaceae bacterium]